MLGKYGIIAFILELLKQLIWAFNYDPITTLVTWDFEWYSFPFQLCSTPIYVSILCLFLKDTKLRKSLLSYIAFVTILGSMPTISILGSCFVNDILANIHTMWLHLGGFVVSIYLLMNKEVKPIKENIKSAILVFLIFVVIAEVMNLSFYNLNIIGDETFNMLYISPYFISSLLVFDIIQEHVPFILYLLIYIIALSIGEFIIYLYIIVKLNKSNT